MTGVPDMANHFVHLGVTNSHSKTVSRIVSAFYFFQRISYHRPTSQAMVRSINMNPKRNARALINPRLLAVLTSAVLFIAACIFADKAHAEEGSWNTTDKVLLTAVETSYYLDFRQTREIALNPRRYYEHNQIIGEHPSVGRVNNYFLASAIGTYLLADALPEKYRRLFLSGALTVEVVTIVHNHKLGLRYNF
jgi:hypothetical protein